MKPLEFQSIDNHQDLRGDSFYIPTEAFDFIGRTDEMHFATVLPGAIRGNHYHAGKNECIVLVFSDRWHLEWKTLEAADVNKQDFEGKGALLIKIQSEVVHAIKNTGTTPLELVSFSNKRYNPQSPDTFRHILLK